MNSTAGCITVFFGHEFHVAVDNRQNSFEPPVFTAIKPAQLEEIERKHSWCAS